MIELKPCPICGKHPIIRRDYGYEQSGFGAWCTIQCRTLIPLFQKPHLKIEEGKSTWDRALEYAAIRWNEAVEQMERSKA